MIRKLLLVAAATSTLLVTSCLTSAPYEDAEGQPDSVESSLATAPGSETPESEPSSTPTTVHEDDATDEPAPPDAAPSDAAADTPGESSDTTPEVSTEEPQSDAQAEPPTESVESTAPREDPDVAEQTDQSVAQTVATEQPEIPEVVTNQPDGASQSWQSVANHLLSSDLEVQVGQLLMVQFRTGRDGRPITSVTDEVREILEAVRPGGVILFAENIVTVEQTVSFIRALQDASDIPLFISVDEEGGLVSRLNRSDQMGATAVPSAERIGRTGNPDVARNAGRIIGTELNALGINMNMAPVADVNTNPADGIIARYGRSFGSNPELVARMVAAMVLGLQESGVSAVLKHFPGHGDTDQDTHTGSVVSDSSLERLRGVELIPFQSGIDTGVDGVMTAHIAYPSITGSLVPATFSHLLLTGLLRRELGFDGLIISDALEMGAVVNSELAEDPVVAAVTAGVDLVLSPRDPISAHTALVSAVRDGTLGRERLRDAVERVLRIKNRRGLFEGQDPSTEELTRRAEGVLGSPEHLKLMENLMNVEPTGSSHTPPDSTAE